MSRRWTALGLTVINILALACLLCPGDGALLTTSAAAQERVEADRPVDKLSVGPPIWHRGSGLLYGSMTFANGNPYPVWKVIIACDVLDQSGQRVGTHASGIRRVFQVGKTHVSGIYFTAPGGLEGGSCRVLSGERYPRSSIPTS